jgi:hypothetical protein
MTYPPGKTFYDLQRSMVQICAFARVTMLAAKSRTLLGNH